ncbi:hypothetical protein RND81_06G210300 [Saponaria officinalis]|uniref:Uncharacterized protein n=1 Tax=Saponaria officinalis TaxID=3572 RepID=A0AAW1K9E2_SAPOF
MASINPPQNQQQNQQQLQKQHQNQQQNHKQATQFSELYTTYIGVSFAVFLSLFPSLHSQNHRLLRRLRAAEDELTELRSRRQEDSKANARVVEIFATHRNSWQLEERRLLRRLDDSSEEISRLRSRLVDVEAEVEALRRDVGERDELLSFMSRHKGGGNGDFGDDNLGGDFNHGFDSRFWSDAPNLWQDVQYESVEPAQHAKHYVVRRESPWKVDGESTGVTSKLKLLEDELLNLEKIGKNSSVKVTSLMRKQAKRYQDISGKIDDLCKRMQESDPSEPALSSEFRSQRQTEFLLEAFQLQQRASETGKKLLTLQTEIYSHSLGDDPETRHAMRRCLDGIRSNFKDIQRNLEIWLARIMGDLEGILARDGANRARDYYFPKYPYANSFN